MSYEERFKQSFSAPSPRKYQDQAAIRVVKEFEENDRDVVMLNAPTGSGKSLIIDTVMDMLDGWSYVTTPLNSLVDQAENDEFISGNIITIKGRNNYNCIHPKDEGTPVDEAICQRDSNFDCDVKGQCPYYGRKDAAIEHPRPMTNMSFLMAHSMIPDHVEDGFGKRHNLAADECQNVEDFGLSYVSVTISNRTVPDMVWDNITIPYDRAYDGPEESPEDDMEFMVNWVQEEVISSVREAMGRLDRISLMSKDESKDFERLRQFELRMENFLKDVERNEWVAEIQPIIRKNRENSRKVVFKPLTIGRFLDNLIWSFGDRILLSSATIPGGNWLDEIGLGSADSVRINVPSIFPVENRPIICGLNVGKMSGNPNNPNSPRSQNLPKMAKRMVELAKHHEGENGFVHCRSYKIAKNMKNYLANNGHGKWVRENVMVQNRNDREGSLDRWLNNDKDVFLSVAMDEGVDLKGDKCRWQLLAKVLYPYQTKRMKRRKEIAEEEGRAQDYWEFYNRKAATQIQQAYGRGVRSPDDECVFYIGDESAIGLFRRSAHLFNKWFLEAIDDIKINPDRGC